MLIKVTQKAIDIAYKNLRSRSIIKECLVATTIRMQLKTEDVRVGVESATINGCRYTVPLIARENIVKWCFNIKCEPFKFTLTKAD